MPSACSKCERQYDDHVKQRSTKNYCTICDTILRWYGAHWRLELQLAMDNGDTVSVDRLITDLKLKVAKYEDRTKQKKKARLYCQ